MDFSKVAPPIFDGEDYDLWAVRMETLLDALDLLETVEDEGKGKDLFVCKCLTKCLC